MGAARLFAARQSALNCILTIITYWASSAAALMSAGFLPQRLRTISPGTPKDEGLSYIVSAGGKTRALLIDAVAELKGDLIGDPLEQVSALACVFQIL